MTSALDHASAGDNLPAKLETKPSLLHQDPDLASSSPTPLETALTLRIQELEALNQYLAEFADAAAHDLRSPLHAVDQLARWIAADENSALSAESRAYFAMLRSQVYRMDQFVLSLLDYALAESPAADVAIVDTAALLGEVIDLLQPPPYLRILPDPALPSVKVSRLRLTQVLLNLVGNAVKHHDRRTGVIEFSARETERGWEFSLRDDGPGIPAEFHESVFGLFRTDRAEFTEEGSGIGLALVKRIVQGWGGDVWVESVGRGTTVLFTIDSPEP